MTDNILIKQWSEVDWVTLKVMRLEAVKKHNNVFLNNYETSIQYNDDHWKDILRDAYQGAVFGLYDGDTPIGLTGAFRYRESPEDTIILGMTYIHESYRGRGLSRVLYEASLDWSKKQAGIMRVIISHRDWNIESKASIIRCGFSLIKTEEKIYGDGTSGSSFLYEKILNSI